MNGRVLLLVLVTGLFMAAWDGDQAAMQAAMARRNQTTDTPVAAVPTDDSRSHDEVKALPINHKEEVDAIDPDTVPLPAGIASGSYQAVNQSGDTVRVEVRNKKEPAVSQNFYMPNGDDGSRWYFIRIE